MPTSRKDRKQRATQFGLDLSLALNRIAYQETGQGKSKFHTLTPLNDFIQFRIKKDANNAHLYRSCLSNFKKGFMA